MRGGSRRDQSWTDSFNLATRCSVLECETDLDGFTGGGLGWGSSGAWTRRCLGSGETKIFSCESNSRYSSNSGTISH